MWVTTFSGISDQCSFTEHNHVPGTQFCCLSLVVYLFYFIFYLLLLLTVFILSESNVFFFASSSSSVSLLILLFCFTSGSTFFTFCIRSARAAKQRHAEVEKMKKKWPNKETGWYRNFFQLDSWSLSYFIYLFLHKFM